MDIILFENYLKESTSLRGSTIKNYMDVIIRFLRSEPDINSIESYRNFFIDNTIKKNGYFHYYAFKKYIEYQIKDTNIKNKLLTEIKKLKIKLGDRTKTSINLTEEQMDIVVSKLSRDKHKLIARIQKECGLRSSDIFWLKDENIYFEKNEKGEDIIRLFFESKGGKHSTAFIYNKNLQSDFKKYVKDMEVIPNSFGIRKNYIPYLFMRCLKKRRSKNLLDPTDMFSMMRIHYHEYWMDLRMAINQCQSLIPGITMNNWSTHDWRRKFANKFYKKSNYNIYGLQQALRHQDINTTIRYLKQSSLEIQPQIEVLQRRKLVVLDNNLIENCSKGDILPEDIADFNTITMLIEQGKIKYADSL